MIGETREEVLGLIQEAIEFHLEGLQADGVEILQLVSVSEYVEVLAA